MEDKKVTLNPEKCMKCGLCSRVCPMQINVRKEAKENNLQVCNKDCIKCGYCVNSCPMDALEFKTSPDKKTLERFNNKNPAKLREVEISETKLLGENIKEIKIKFPEKLEFKPGQYILIQVDKEMELFRAYSISWINDRKTVSFIIKKLSDGLASEAIFNLKEGDKISVEGPYEGEFSLDSSDKSKDNLCFIAAGIGITPFLALSKKALEKNKKVTLFHSAKYEDGLLYKDFFQKLNEKYNNFTYIPSVTRENPKDGEKDKVKSGRVNKHLPEYNLENHEFFICGQKGLVKNTEKIVNKKFSNTKIREESFE